MNPDLWLEPAEPLSREGAARRDAMLGELDAAMRRRNVVRTGRRGAAVLVPVLAVACGVLMWGQSPGGGPAGKMVPKSGHVAAGPAPGAPVASSYEFIRIVETDPGVMERYRAGPAVGEFQVITDDELQSLLASVGRDTGIVRTGGRVILATDLIPPTQEPGEPGRDPSSSI